MRVEGPYSPKENTGFESADHLICLVGGTGVTGAISLAHWWLEHRSLRPQSLLTVVWTVGHPETAKLREWEELEAACQAQALQKSRLTVHVSSESGRINPLMVLRVQLAIPASTDEKKNMTAIDKTAWIYMSGPVGLLRSGEDACVDLELEIKRAGRGGPPCGLPVSHMEYHVAKWEV